ncbi:Venom carboxylesterase-6 [Habropoda laboriosa]|uniref:Carboxylic ester hydrolase n=1 Tax=Habropoda laboriosa TaxID=597456 RepID=A0A0L7QZ65_9HYME|nr:PREDICTED: venom carboxylesterase-6-like [Habropoda laboriosa]KOC63846.1 Venom carboxylesterase-6 [Habropoda laboriosa]
MIAVKISTVLLFLGLVHSSLQDEKLPKVNTPLGSIIGYHKKSRNGKAYRAFEGVPYAAPPVGELRFQPPKPVQSWEGDLPANKKSSVCTQYLMSGISGTGERVTGCEDCLYLNIYVPERNNNKELLPVMFWIHGGAYQFASGNEANETFIMDTNVVLVTVNYRLGPFGFLSTGDKEVPGNMGLKDQSLALRWVHDYIKNFGGDPNQITIFGMSAGGSSVHYHYLTKWSAGLFQRGISISGVALNPWPQTENAPEKAKKLGAILGCPTDDSYSLVSCLQSRPARLISQAVGDFMYWKYNPFTPFGPVVEKEGDNPFISDTPINVIAKGEATDVPWITGVVSEEGLYPAAEFVNDDKLLKQLNDDWDKIAPYLLDCNDTIPLSQQKAVVEKIRKYYLGSKEINKDSVMPLIHMIGDRLFSVDCEKAARLQAKRNKSPVWTYLYSYRASHSLSDGFTNSDRNFGVSHGDDIFLVLSTGLSNVVKPKDIEMQNLLVKLYTSFAIEGKPRVDKAKWEPLKHNEKSYRYLHIAAPQKVNMHSDDNFAQKKFWSTIKFNENKVCHKKHGKKKGKH